MKKTFYTLALLAAAPLAGASLNAQTNMNQPNPPVAAKKPKTTEIHGYKLTDDYFWLREKDQTGKPVAEAYKYLEAENAYTEAVMKPTADLQKKLYDEMLGRIKQTDDSVPYRLGNYTYFTRFVEGKQYPVYLRKKLDKNAAEETTLDGNKMAEGLKFFSIGSYTISPDGNLLAFSTDTTGYRQYTLQIKDLRTGQILPNKIERVTSTAWAADNNTLFVGTEDQTTKRSDKIFRHDVKANATAEIYTEKDELFQVGVGASRDKKTVYIQAGSSKTSEIRYLPADQPTGEFKIVLPRETDVEYDAEIYDGKFFITTNKGAKNSRVVTAPLNDPTEKNWKEFVAHNPKIKISNVSFFKNHAVVSERENGLEYLRVIDMKSKDANNKAHRIETPEPVYTIGLAANPEFDVEKIRFNYNSMVTPTSTVEYDLNTKQRTTLKEQEIPSGYDKTKYEAKRIFVKSRDGSADIPVALVYKKGVKMDGSAPMLLYAYGSYGASIPPSFSTARTSLIDRGVIYALASIRGGGELGEDWRDAGKMYKKINTFTDFVDVADYMAKNKYTSADKLVIQGGSAGGLLMGAVVNLSPQSFKAAIAQVPFVDVINTMLDASLPLTTGEYIEWGNPNEKAAFDYIRTYSPYDNVKAQKYPSMLIEVSLNDSQVPYWEGAKWAAKLRAMKTDDNVLLLKTNMGAGHGGASGRYDRLKEIAFDYAFALNQVGINE